MKRLYYSSSLIELAESCERAYYYQYHLRLRQPEIPWELIEAGKITVRYGDERPREGTCTASQKGQSLGGVMHRLLERWHRGRAKGRDWRTFVGQVASSGLQHLPHPEECHETRIEESIGDTPLVLPAAERTSHAPANVLMVEGVPWGGVLDFWGLLSRRALRRLSIASNQGDGLLVDYKSSSNLRRYAPTPDELLQRIQPNLYALHCMTTFATQEQATRFVYFETKKIRRALPVDIVVERNRAHDFIAAKAKLVRRLEQIECEADAEQNTDSCHKYGGCWLHESVGGPCNARRSLGADIQSRVRIDRGVDMVSAKPKADKRAQFLARKKQLEAAAAESEDVAENAEESEDADNEDAAESETAPVARRQRRAKKSVRKPGRKPGRKARPRFAPESAPAPEDVEDAPKPRRSAKRAGSGGGAADAVIALQGKLGKAREKLAVEQGRVDELLAQIASAARG